MGTTNPRIRPSSVLPGPDDGHVGDRAVGDPHLVAVEDPVGRRRGGRGCACEPGSEPKSGSVSPKQPIASPAAIRGSHSCFCSSLPCFQIANIASDPCTDDQRPQAGVAGLELHAGQAVRRGAGARAAVALEVHAEDAERAELAWPAPGPAGSADSYQPASSGLSSASTYLRTVSRIARSSSPISRSVAKSSSGAVRPDVTGRAPARARSLPGWIGTGSVLVAMSRVMSLAAGWTCSSASVLS